MDARELRIGNVVSRIDLGNEELIIETIIELGQKATISGPIKVICEYDDIHPIPLTEEWLEKYGFTQDERNKFEWWDEEGGTSFDNCLTGPFRTYTNGGHVVLIEYVHQLQNLYFALTGTELEIKDK